MPPDNVPYGSSEFFRLQEGSAGAGFVTIFIADADNPDCTISVLVEVTGPCSFSCFLDDAGLTNVHCEDNNETNSQADDYIWFQLNPSGGNYGTGYNIKQALGM